MTRVGALAVCLVACKTVTNDRPAAAIAASATPLPPRPRVEALPPAPSVVDEGPLAWGTRPPSRGPLFPVVDGMCVHGEIWPTKVAAIYTYGNGLGPWSRGGESTIARFTDEGLDTSDAVTKSTSPSAWAEAAPLAVIGTWPSPLVLFSNDQGNSRMRDFPSIWTHGESGWSLLASHRDVGAPGFGKPILVRGHIITTRTESTNSEDGTATSVKTFPLEKTAAPIRDAALLVRPGFSITTLAANDANLYALGWADDPKTRDSRSVLRIVSEGKAREITLPTGELRVVATAPSLVLLIDGRSVYRVEDGKLARVDLRQPVTVRLSPGVAPNGDIWALTSKKTIVIARRDATTKTDTIEESPLPAAAAPGPKDTGMHWPTSGSLLAGVDVDDPYAVGDGGSLFHFEFGKWSEVDLPTPPFAATGKYQAQALVVPAKGDVYVNAGYAEKGLGWRTEERYRAVLRNKRPREVLRCNEPSGGAGHASGRGFMSFPPIAQDTCTTPFVVLLRLGYGMTTKAPTYIYDRKSDYPSVREAIKATPSLGASVDLVEVVTGDQRYLGARVSSVAAGRELAANATKKINGGGLEVRPEVVCGTPTEARVIHVDVATGKAN